MNTLPARTLSRFRNEFVTPPADIRGRIVALLPVEVEMGRTVVTATLTGDSSSREHEFLVDTGSTHIGLPSDEIRSLGLPAVPNGRIRVLTATGVVEQETFSAIGQVLQRGFVATVTPASIPLIGYELLENLRLKVNPVKRELENVPDEQLAPPYQLVRL